MRSIIRFLISAALLVGCSKNYQSRGTTLPDEVAARIKSSPSYAANAKVTSDGEVTEAVDAALAEAKNGVRHDPALDCVAHALVDTFAEEARLPTHLLRNWIAWRCGLPSPDFGQVARRVRGATADVRVKVELNGALREVIGRAREPGATFIGAARLDLGKNRVFAVVSAARSVEIEPFTKTYAPGAELTVRGRWTTARKNPWLYSDWMADGGHAQPMSDDGTFEIRQRLPTVPGRYFLQLVSSTVDGPNRETGGTRNTALWFPVYVGVAEPSVPELPRVDNADAQPAAWSTLAVAAYNRERARLGRPPLVASEPLAANALERSKAVLAKNAGAVTARLDAELIAGGFPSRSWSAASVDSLPELVATTLWQPELRAELLDPRATALGIGATAPPPAADDMFLPESLAVQIIARSR